MGFVASSQIGWQPERGILDEADAARESLVRQPAAGGGDTTQPSEIPRLRAVVVLAEVDVLTSEPPMHRIGAMFCTRRSDLRAIAYKIIGHGDMVEDVLQDAYIKLLEGACCREVLNPFGYCCQVVRNTAIDYCRRRVVEACHFMQSPDGELPEVPDGHSADAGFDERRLLERIDAILAALPTRTRLVFEMYRLHGKTQREIAKEVGVSPTLVNFVIRDAMNALASYRGAFDERASV